MLPSQSSIEWCCWHCFFLKLSHDHLTAEHLNYSYTIKLVFILQLETQLYKHWPLIFLKNWLNLGRCFCYEFIHDFQEYLYRFSEIFSLGEACLVDWTLNCLCCYFITDLAYLSFWNCSEVGILCLSLFT